MFKNVENNISKHMEGRWGIENYIIKEESRTGKTIYMIGGIRVLDELLENERFCTGIAVGISLHQQRVIAAHERKEPIKVGDELFFLQSGREKLEEMLEKICR